VDFILQIAAAEVLGVRLLERYAVARGPADVRRDADVTTRGEGGRCAAKGVHCLAGGAAVRKHDPWIAPVAFQVERHPQKCADDLVVEAAIVNKLRFGKAIWIQTGDGRKRELLRGPRRNTVNPNIRRSCGALVGDQHPAAIGRERGWASGERRNTWRKVQLFGTKRGTIDEIQLRAAIFVDQVSEAMSIGREFTRLGLPLEIGYPRNLLRGNVEQRNIIKTAFAVGSDERRRAIGGNG